MILQYLATIPPETWGILATGGATVIAGFAKVKKDYKKKETAQLLKVAKVIAKTTQETIADIIESRDHIKSEQIEITREFLSDYGADVTKTSKAAVKTMVSEANPETIEILSALWADAVCSTFLIDVLNYFIRHVISKNGFREKTERQIESIIDDVMKKAFCVFIRSIKGRFAHEKIRLRADWIRENMDMIAMRKLVSSIIYGCRDISEAHYKTGEEKAKELPQKIMRELVA